MVKMEPSTNQPNLLGNAAFSESSTGPPPPTYAESLLYHKAFRFQSRHGAEKLDLRGISKVDISKIIKNSDIETLQTFLENICFAEIEEADFDLYSNDCFVKLFQVAQLTLEYLLHVQDTLSANLNGLAKKYAGKKREIESLATNLAKQDAEVAMLRDEIHYNKDIVRRYEAKRMSDSAAGEVSRLDFSLFPSQEKRATLADGTNSQEYQSSNSPSEKNSIVVHIASANDGKYLQLNIPSSISVQDLRGRIVSGLGTADDATFDCFSMLYKNKELRDVSQTLENCGIADNGAIVFMALQQPKMQSPIESPPEKQQNNERITQKLEELAITAMKSHEELIHATRLLSDQVSYNETKKDAFVQEIGKQLKSLEKSLHEEVQCRVHNAVSEQRHKQFNVQQVSSDGMTPATPHVVSMKASDLLTQLNIGELEIVHSDDEETENEKHDNETDDANKQDVSKQDENKQDESRHDDKNDEDNSKQDEQRDAAASALDDVGEKARGVSLQVDTEAEFLFCRQMGEFVPPNPPKAIDIFDVKSHFAEEHFQKTDVEQQSNPDSRMKPRQQHPRNEDGKTNKEIGSPFKLPESYNIQPDSNKETNKVLSPVKDQYATDNSTPTATKGYLDRGENSAFEFEQELSNNDEGEENPVFPTSFWNEALQNDLQTVQDDAEQFGFAEFDEEPNHHVIEMDAMKITPGRPMTAESDLQSIEVSHSDFYSNLNGDIDAEKEKESSGSKVGKKKSVFSWKKQKGSGSKKRISIMPKWRKQKSKSDQGDL